MAIGFGNEQAAVFVSDPVRDRLEINSFLDGIVNEEMSQAMMRKARKTGNATCVSKAALADFNLNKYSSRDTLSRSKVLSKNFRMAEKRGTVRI